MSSTTLSLSPPSPSCKMRSRASSMTDSPSLESSSSSDSHSSSDPDIQLLATSPWAQTPNRSSVGKELGMEVDDNIAAQYFMDLDSEMSFNNGIAPDMHVFHGSGCNFKVDEIIHNNASSNEKSDILLLEELIRDSALDSTIMGSTPFSSYSAHTHYFQDESKASSSTSIEEISTPSQDQLSCIAPLSTQKSQPSPQGSVASAPSQSPTPEERRDTLEEDDFSTEPLNVPSLPPDMSAAKEEANCPPIVSTSPQEPPAAPPLVVSSKVVYPPRSACQDLTILFPTIPSAGTKSRVETQIKLEFQLVIPASSTSSPPVPSQRPSASKSPSASPSLSVINIPPGNTDEQQLPATHDRVGTYKYLRLPDGMTTKRRPPGKPVNGEEFEETLQMTADVTCSSFPNMVVQSCESCQFREAKRTARKVAARVRPPPNMRPKPKDKGTSKKSAKKAKEQDSELQTLDEMEDMDEPNVDGSILQFNCIDVLDFSNGKVMLPIRITCYCRHHKEKIGFNVVFALRDHTGRLVGRGVTPPILITDDHKSTNAVSKPPLTHPLRQTLQLSLPAPVVPSHAKSEEPPSIAAKKREVEPASKKRRPKPYDGRPERMVGVRPGIEGRQGVVLALHPAHSRVQSLPTTRSPTPTFFDPSQNASRQGELPVPTSTGSPVSSVASSTSILSQGFDGFQPPMFVPLEQQLVYNKVYPIYPSFSPPLNSPKIHRLIPSSGPTTGGIEITVLGSNFSPSLPLQCVFGGTIASSTHRWSDNTLVCVLPPRATPGAVNVEIQGVMNEDKDNLCLFNYVDESDRQLMELALQVVGLKMTGKIEEARNVAMRIVGNTNSPSPTMTAGELTQMTTLSETSFVHHSLLGSLGGVDLETLIIKLLTLLDVPTEDKGKLLPSVPHAIRHKNATGQTLIHLAVLLALPSLTSCLIGRSIDIDAQNNDGLTALHFAAMKGWREGVEILLAEGANTTIADLAGLTPAQRAKDAGFRDLEVLIYPLATVADGESGEDGDDEAWQSEAEESDDPDYKPTAQWSQPLYAVRSRVASSTYLEPASDSSEPKSPPEYPLLSINTASKVEGLPPLNIDHVDQKPLPQDEKHDASFVERLQRNLPQGILPNVQMPGLPHLQFPDMPWAAFPQIPVFPIIVPMPNLPNLPNLPNWPAFFGTEANGGGKKDEQEERDGVSPGEKQQQQQPTFAMLWTAYDSITNNAWRAQWEKWTALQTANSNGANAELPPYTPRSEEQVAEDVLKAPEIISVPAVHDMPSQQLDPKVVVPETTVAVAETCTSPKPPASKVTRRVGYNTLNVPETEVEAYHFRPKSPANKQDRMLVLFWIPILFLGIAYALYTLLPIAVDAVSRASQRLLPAPLQRI